VPNIRVLLAALTPFRADIIRKILSQAPDMDVLGPGSRPDALPAAAEIGEADVLILGSGAGRHGGEGDGEIEALLEARPRIKILALEEDGRNVMLHELRPRAVSLGDLSAGRLIDAIRDAVLSHTG
jgi:DNA-binding NarL/FixJ family response regulator